MEREIGVIADQEEFISSKMVEKFNDHKVPYKIRKIELLEAVGLPTPKAEFFKTDDIEALKSVILKKLQSEDCSLILRVACNPDKFSMPFFFIENDKLDQILDEIRSLVEKDPTIKYFILQEATPEEAAKDKISGRILFENGEMMPEQEVVEIYKGSRSTNVLNNVDVSDANFFSFVKTAGEFMKPVKKLTPDSLITENEVKDIYNLLNTHREKIEGMIDIIAKSQMKTANDLSVSVEFSYRDGRIVFSDIDF